MRNRENTFFKHETVEITFFVIFGIVMSIILPIFLGFGLGAFEGAFVRDRPLQFGDFLVNYMIYYILIVSALIGLPVLKLRELFVTNKNEHPATQSNPKHFSVAVLHDPEQDGALYNLFDSIGLKDKKNPMRWSHSIFRTLIIASLIFGAIGIFQASSGFQFVGLPQLTFQIAPEVSSVLLTAEPPSWAETLTMIFVMSLILGELAWLVSKLKFGKAVYFFIALIIVSLIIGGLWTGYHTIVYGNDEAKLMATFIFGTVGAFMTILTGTFIYWWAFHFWNNFFVKFAEVATSNEDLIFISVIIWVIMFVLYVGGEIAYSRFKKKKEYVPETPD